MTCCCHVMHDIIQKRGEIVMLDKNPSAEELLNLVGKPLYDVWIALTGLIETKYDTERLWNSGGKAWKYEYKYCRGGKRCALSMQEKTVSASWWYSGKMRGLNLRQAEIVIQRKR